MRGIISALVIPFNYKQEVDYEKLKSVIDYNINISKVDALYINGSTGENFTIDTKTKKEIFKVVSNHVNKRVELIAQIGSINLQEVLELGKYVKSLESYKAVSAVTPFYYKFSFDEIKNYYDIITKEVEMDMIIYSIPNLTGVNMGIKEIDQLFENPMIKGIKFTSNDFYTLERVKTKYPDKLLYSGFDEMLISAAVMGIDGAIGSTYNFQAYLAKDILKHIKNNEVQEALKIQRIMNDNIDKLLEAGLYQTIKAVLTEDGCDAGICNLPFSNTTSNQRKVAKEILNNIK